MIEKGVVFLLVITTFVYLMPSNFDGTRESSAEENFVFGRRTLNEEEDSASSFWDSSS